METNLPKGSSDEEILIPPCVADYLYNMGLKRLLRFESGFGGTVFTTVKASIPGATVHALLEVRTEPTNKLLLLELWMMNVQLGSNTKMSTDSWFP